MSLSARLPAGTVVSSRMEIPTCLTILPDNVVKQATDYFLLTGPEAPLKLFSPNFVSALSPDELDQIASEAPVVKRERSRLKKEIWSLEVAKSILTRT